MTASIYHFPRPADPAEDYMTLAARYFTTLGMPPSFAEEHGDPALAAAMRGLAEAAS